MARQRGRAKRVETGLPEALAAELAALCERLGVTVAVGLRAAVALWIAQQRKAAAR